MHVSLHPAAMVGLVLVALTLALYVVAAGLAIMRVQRQYNTAMSSMRGLRLGAVLVSIARLWPVAIAGAIGIVLLVFGR